MKTEQLIELLKNYRLLKARCAYLRSQIETLERWLEKCERDSVSDQISLSQAITGMPHGSGTGDPTGRLAMDIASGKVSTFVAQIREELEEINLEYRQKSARVHLVDIVLEALSEKERKLVEMKIIDEMSWIEIIDRLERGYKASYANSKRSLQRMLCGALEKAEKVVA